MHCLAFDFLNNLFVVLKREPTVIQYQKGQIIGLHQAKKTNKEIPETTKWHKNCAMHF